MKIVTTRTAKLEDLPTLYQFEQGIIKAERPYDSTLADDPISYYDLKHLVESENAEVIVATHKNELVGAGYINIVLATKPYLKFTHYGHLGFMFVKPEYRGNGINKMIMDKLIAWGKSKNLTEVRLNVYSDNPSAIRAYEKAGFENLMINMRMGI